MDTPANLNQLFLDASERFSTKRAALRYKENGAWHEITHQEVVRKALHVAMGLRELGVPADSRVAILSENRPEWAIADYGCLIAGCTDVPVYPTLTAPQAAFIMKDSQSVAVFVENPEQYRKLQEVRQDIPGLKHVIYFEGKGYDADALSFADLIQKGAAAESKYGDLEKEARETSPDAVATIIYTSGTTGNPKGVMLTHRNITSDVVGSLKVLPVGPDDSCLSFLPLSHSFERTCGHYAMYQAGIMIDYAENIETVAANMLEVKPTVVLSVPRLYEKIYARVLDNAVAGGALKRRIFFWARAAAEEWADLTLAQQPVPWGLGMKKKLADKLVFSKVQARTGGRLRYFVSGGAALSPEIAKFFFAAGLPIIEGYGLTETSPVITVNPFDAPRIGSVGKAIPGVEIKIAEDGEILCRGPNVMKGYFNLPEATDEAIDSDGWFHTGDLGELDSDGYLKITDRKKDIIVTAHGKNIAPQPIENMIKTNKFVSNAVMLGNGRKFPIVLVVPDLDALKGWAAERNLPAADPASLLGVTEVVAKVEREVMGNVRGLASYEMPKKVILIEKDFTIEDGELTPSMKVKRRVVEEKYREQIDKVYAEDRTTRSFGI